MKNHQAAGKEYANLRKYSKQREQEVSAMVVPFTDVTEKYGKLLTRICLIVGKHEPQSVQDAVLRDLMADVFDFLYESTAFVNKGQSLIAYPLARRAYESLSLMHWCALDEEVANKWHNGKKVGNHEIRQALASHPMGENEKELKEMYNLYCGFTHVNREMIAFRGLGEGNSFVFGSIGAPNLITLVDYCLNHLELWFWFCPVAVFAFRSYVFSEDKAFNTIQSQVREEAQSVRKWLFEQRNNVIEEWKNDSNIVQPKYS